MKFEIFLKQAVGKDFWHDNKKIIFIGKNYSTLFFLELFNFLESKKILPATFKNFLFNNLTGKNDLAACLKQSFLGQYNFYWLGNIEKINADQADLLLNYSGPNYVALFLSDEKIISKYKKVDYIEIASHVNIENFESIISFFQVDLHSQKIDLIEKVLKLVTVLEFDQFLLIIKYLELINVKFIQEFYDYLTGSILNFNPSLNLLSQYFWAKNKEQFFKTWSNLFEQYPDVFWVTYWSEQVWKAYFVIKYLKNNNFVEAKSLSYGLPFMFAKQYWQNYSLDFLEKEFQYLYLSDYNLKTGKNFCFFDYFYLRHFSS